MIHNDIFNRISVQLVGMAMGNALGEISPDKTDSSVQNLQKAFIADLYTVTAIIVLCQLLHGQLMVFAVFQDVIRSESVQCCTSRFPGQHRT